jgi:ABC-2 type transport system ATP-binding protein
MSTVLVENIIKTYGKKKEIKALNDISFEVKAGELFGIIGPDGAGKTSLFRILTTLLLADSGKATIGDCDVVNDYKKIRDLVGYMPGRFSLYQDLTVKENLDFFATIFNTSVEKNYHLIKDIYSQIEPFKHRMAGKLSGGMKQKLALSCALIHRPSVLFLDEPTTGVDAVSRKEFWQMLTRLKQQGITILVSTPYMDEAALCDRVALIQTGNVLSINSPGQIVAAFGKSLWGIRAGNMLHLLNDLRSYEGTDHAYPSGTYHHVIMKTGYSKEQLRLFLSERQHEYLEMATMQPNIEDCFMQLMRTRHAT